MSTWLSINALLEFKSKENTEMYQCPFFPNTHVFALFFSKTNDNMRDSVPFLQVPQMQALPNMLNVAKYVKSMAQETVSFFAAALHTMLHLWGYLLLPFFTSTTKDSVPFSQIYPKPKPYIPQIKCSCSFWGKQTSWGSVPFSNSPITCHISQAS